MDYKKFLKLFGINVVFFILIGIMFLVVRRYVVDYIVLMMSYAEEVSTIAQISDQSLLLEKAGFLAQTMEPIIQKLLLMVYLVFPLGIYLIWSVCQGIYYNLIFNKKVLDFKRLGYFMLFNLPFFAVFFLLIEFFFRQITDGEIMAFNIFAIVIIFIMLFFLIYLLSLSYVFVHKYSFVKTLKKALNLSLKKVHILFFAILLNVVLFILVFIFLWDILIKINVGVGGYYKSCFLFILALFAWIYYRLFLFNFIRKIK